MLGGLSDDARTEAWAEIEEALRRYQKGDAGFEGPCELHIAVGTR